MKTNHFRVLQFVTLAAVLSSSGCASIMSGRYADVHLDSNPTHAQVVVHDHKGLEVAQATTPAVVSLKRKREWFLPAKYTATFSSPGYTTAQVPMRSTVNWWGAGNIIVGGVPGLLVDTATGAGWKPKHDHITQTLTPIDGAPTGPAFAREEQTQSPRVADQSAADSNVEPASGTY